MREWCYFMLLLDLVESVHDPNNLVFLFLNLYF
jgi:hypothetical protein